MSSTVHFGDRLAKLVTARGPICAGVDPRPEQLPHGLDAAAWAAVTAQLLGDKVAAIKPQLAFFDDAWAAPEAVARAASPGGAVVIADCKRGDIDSTAKAYAERILGKESPFDACTVNPLLGADSLAPFVEAAAKHGRGLFVLVRTSNPGAADVQDLQVPAPGGGTETLSERLARLVDALGRPHVGQSGVSIVGAVVGLTAPVDLLRRLRRLMPHAPLLVPGYGAQGGKPEALDACLDDGGAGGAKGVVVSASRSLTLPWKGAAPADWRDQVLAALEAMRADLSTRVASGDLRRS